MTMKRYTQETERFERTISSLDLQELKDIPLFGDKWDAAEEIMLLTLIQTHNYGNWSVLAEILTDKSPKKKKFTAEEVKEHYINIYLEGDIAKAMKSVESNTSKSSLIDHCSKEDDEWLKSVDMDACENVPQDFLEKIGYMPLREDFKTEYDHTAEDLIQNLDFSVATDSYDKNVNLILLDTYRNRLMERIERKRAVKKFRIVEKFFAKNNPSYEKKYPEENLSSTESYNTPNIHEVNEVSSTSKKTRNQRFKHLRKNLEKSAFVHPSDCDDEEEIPSRKKCKPKRRRNLRSNKSMTLYSVLSDNTSENEAVESDKKSNLTIDDFPEAEFLTRAEKRLCTDLGLKPAYYIRYKLLLTYVDLERSEGRYPNENLIPAHMTVAQCLRVVNFMEKFGWVKNQNLLNVVDYDDSIL